MIDPKPNGGVCNIGNCTVHSNILNLTRLQYTENYCIKVASCNCVDCGNVSDSFKLQLNTSLSKKH